MIDDVSLEGRLKEASRDHEWHEGDQVMKVKGPGSRVGGQGQVIGAIQ